MGRNGGHQRGDSTAAYGEVLMATVKERRRELRKHDYLFLLEAERKLTHR